MQDSLQQAATGAVPEPRRFQAGPEEASFLHLKNILIVDDNAVNRRILKRILSDEYNIIEADNGAAALSILHQNHESISVVLLDIVMPILDGYEVLRQMHADVL